MSSLTPSPAFMSDLQQNYIRPIPQDFRARTPSKEAKEAQDPLSDRLHEIRLITESPVFNPTLHQIQTATEGILRALAIAYRRSNEDDWRQAIQTFQVLCPALSEDDSSSLFISLIKELFKEGNPHLLERKMMESPFEPVLDCILRQYD